MLFKRVSLACEQTGETHLASELAAMATRALGAGKQTYPLRNLAACVVDQSQVRFAGLGADEHTEFEIASITKTFNAELLRQAIERGEAASETTVGDVLGAHVRGTPLKTITLAELADHTSGLPRTGRQKPRNVLRAFLGRNPDVGITAGDVMEQAASAQIKNRGTEKYSNLGHDLLGQLLAMLAGMSYAHVITERILDPLGMEETYVALPGTVGPDRPRGVSVFGRPVEAWEMDGTAPSGGLRSTASDMATYASYVLRLGAPRFTWLNIPGTELYWHNGGTFGFSSMLLLDMENQRASFVAADSYTEIESFAFELLGLADPAEKK